MKIKLLMLIGLIAVAAVAVGALRNSGTNSPDAAVIESSNVSVAPTPEEIKEVEEQKAALAPASEAARYTHPTYGFSFEKPTGYSVGALPNETGGQTLIVQPAGESGGAQGFQIYISPLDAPLELTPTLIKEQLPGASVNNAQKILLDGKGSGMMFSSNNESFGGRSFEIWFTDSKNLYQVTSYASFAPTLQQIIGTWKF